ncbi:rhombosortase [Colwellia sp. Bg11-28]|uniref:rhombosortase n=1 Tax=Colwellia sp. Bg11-28 TaxID=2058305 RepID=UPI000C34E599|nr:rhombosortase [Colwellia sp. Bg11-28]PKH87947.1 rhombosortase [Colwellia sp. Bg11-28]
MTLTFKNLPLKKQHSMLVTIIAILAVLAYLFNDAVSEFFVYQYQLISQGELWRTFTGHFFHTNGIHLLLNLAALALLWALHGHFYNVKSYSLLFITSALTCSTGMYFFSPEIRQYVGLSGVLHGIFVFGAIMDIRHKDKTGYLLFVGVWLKIAHEQFYGASEQVSSLIDANVAVDAHLWGAVGGLLFSSCYVLMTKKTISSYNNER